MKNVIIIFSSVGAIFLCSEIARAYPLTNFGLEYVVEYRSSPPYRWWSRYDISFLNQDLIIDIDIHLYGDDSSALQPVWESGIETIWSTAFDITDGTYLYDTVFNVDWVSDPSISDFQVLADANQGRSNMLHWYMDRPHGFHEELAAHEFGHMMGLFDEYQGGAVDPDTGLIRDSIMGYYYRNNDPFADHYDSFRNWLQDKSGLELFMVNDTGSHYYSSVPEPATILLFGIGLLGLAKIRRKK